MIENAIEIFSGHCFRTLTGKVNSARGLLVKKHSENLQTHGDFSFPSSLKSWHDYLNANDHCEQDNVTILQCIGKDPSYLVEESISWNLRLKNVREDSERFVLFLERPLAISVGFPEALKNNILITRRLENKNTLVRTDPTYEQSNCLTTLRVHYLSKVIENLCAICEKSPRVLVTARSSSKSTEETVYNCGPVLNAKSGSKETTISSEEFIRYLYLEIVCYIRASTIIGQSK